MPLCNQRASHTLFAHTVALLEHALISGGISKLQGESDMYGDGSKLMFVSAGLRQLTISSPNIKAIIYIMFYPMGDTLTL